VFGWASGEALTRLMGGSEGGTGGLEDWSQGKAALMSESPLSGVSGGELYHPVGQNRIRRVLLRRRARATGGNSNKIRGRAG
jgi:hypothetical protein